MNKHNITGANYREDFVNLLAKKGIVILQDWLGIPKEKQANFLNGEKAFVSYANAGDHIHIWHMSTGIIGEALELLEANTEGADGTIHEELSDALFYIVGMSKHVGFDNWIQAFEHFDRTIRMNSQDKIGTEDMNSYLLSAMRLDDFCKKYNVYYDIEKMKEITTAWLNFTQEWCFIAADYFPTLQDAIDYNVNKLSDRYDGIVYSNEAAKNRADKNIDEFPSGT